MFVHTSSVRHVRTRHCCAVDNVQNYQDHIKLHKLGTARAREKQSATFQTQIARPHDGLYIATCPLAGLSRLPASLGHQLARALPSHVMVLVVLESTSWECCVFDFLPRNPASPLAALRLAAGFAVPGAPLYKLMLMQPAIPFLLSATVSTDCCLKCLASKCLMSACSSTGTKFMQSGEWQACTLAD
jgi:hypothetical protein